MDENFENRPENGRQNVDIDPVKVDDTHQDIKEDSPESKIINLHRDDNEVNRLSMDDKGNIRAGSGGAAIANASRVFVILGWISAALTFLISPLFAITGIIFGVLVNRDARGSGNSIIITNIVLAVLGMIFSVISSMIRY